MNLGTFLSPPPSSREWCTRDERFRAEVVRDANALIPFDHAFGALEGADLELSAAQSGAVPYPMLPYHGLLHTALGAELPDYMQGKESAEKTLADVEAAYVAAAKEKGFLN